MQYSENTPRLAFKVHPGNGPHLLLVHGFLSSSAQWLANLEALSAVCKPITVDLWGHGRSPAPKDKTHYSPEAYAGQFEQIRLQLGIERWFVCGYSLGAGLTIRYAFDHAQHVYGHIFTNSNSALAGPEQIQEWLDSAPKSAANIRSKGLAAIDRIAVHPRRARNLPEAVKAPLLADCAMLKPEGVANTLEYTNPFTSVREIAAANPRPLLLCCGVKEKRFADNRQWAEANLTNLSVVEIDAGHGVNMEGAEAFNLHVCAFVKSHADP
jgi:2-succinyl-6-hydroxy-2,4-cyclohexadiene-1-carboxylate synthase